jgi:hypothetical protein
LHLNISRSEELLTPIKKRVLTPIKKRALAEGRGTGGGGANPELGASGDEETRLSRGYGLSSQVIDPRYSLRYPQNVIHRRISI